MLEPRCVGTEGTEYLHVGIEPFDGYSESWLKESFSSGSLKEIMDEIDTTDS